MRALFALAPLLLLSHTGQAEDPWKSALERNGVRVEARAVNGSKIREVRATAVLDVPARRIIAVLSDVESYPSVMPPTSEAKLLRRDGEIAYYYMVIDPPVVSRRDYCIRTHASRSIDGVFRSEWSVSPDGCPPTHSGLIRIERNSGSWLVTPLGPESTRVDYQAFTDPRGDVPAWIVNRITQRALPDMFSLVKKAALSARYNEEAKR